MACTKPEDPYGIGGDPLPYFSTFVWWRAKMVEYSRLLGNLNRWNDTTNGPLCRSLRFVQLEAYKSE